MTDRNTLARLLALAALAAAAPASAGSSDAAYSVRNDTGRRINCSVRVSGSSQFEVVMIKIGATWSARYSAKKGVRVRCEGAYSVWTRLDPGATYAAVEPTKGIIHLRAGS